MSANGLTMTIPKVAETLRINEVYLVPERKAQRGK